MAGIEPIWILVFAGLALYLFMNIRRRQQRASPEVRIYARRIEGFQVQAYLHPRAGGACLADHGVLFGKGFRRKEGPSLPHDEQCRCQTVPFSFTSTEVFHGALRHGRAPEVSIAGLSAEDAERLLRMLRSWNGRPVPETAEAFLAGTDLSEISHESRPQVEAFLRDRYDFLRSQQSQPQLTNA
jgi:hypothetical protein